MLLTDEGHSYNPPPFASRRGFNKRIKHSFPYINVCQAECDNVLQSEPRSGDGAAIGYKEKNVISSFYSVVCRNVHRNIMKRTTKPRRIGGNRKRLYYRRT